MRALAAFLLFTLDIYIVVEWFLGTQLFLGVSVYYLNSALRICAAIWMGGTLSKASHIKCPKNWMTLVIVLPYFPLIGFKESKEEIYSEAKSIEENQDDGIFNRIKNKKWGLIHSLALSVIVGFALVTLTIFKIIKPSSKEMGDFLIIIGGTILVSGISSFVLQLFSSVKFFQKELVKTFYDIFSSDAKYLETIDYQQLRKNWDILSTHVYGNKFSELSEDLHDIISNKYFPKGHPVYYDDYRVSAKYRLHEDSNLKDEFIELIETVSLDIVPNQKGESVYYDFQSIVPKLGANATTLTSATTETNSGEVVEDNITSLELLEFTINGTDYSVEEMLEPPNYKLNKEVQEKSKKRVLDKGESKYFYYKTIPLSGEERYKVRVKRKKVYSLKTNQFKSFVARRIINGMTIDVEYPNEMAIEFCSSGTIKKFESLKENTGNFLLERYTGLILPRQGYNIALRIRQT